MKNQPAPNFDFDDWAGLYLENPQEFEARREAALMIELARGTAEQREKGRALLEAYEKQAQGYDSVQRMQLAASMMVESARELSTELMILKQALQSIEEQKDV